VERLILGSGSPRRRELLARLGQPFSVVAPSGVDESKATGRAAERCRELALAKARWVLERLEEDRHTVIGADTLVVLGEGEAEQVIGKPRDGAHARELLRALSGRTHRVMTGVAVLRKGSAPLVAVETSEVTFRRLEDAEIAAYVASGEAEGKAGAYGIQSRGGDLVAGFRGCYYNIVGLPLALLAAMLRLRAFDCDCGRHPRQRGERGCAGGVAPPPVQ
jgi:septum formation protein